MSKKFIEHRPRYVSGFENKEYDVKTFDEVLNIPFVKKFSEHKNFHSYAVSVDVDGSGKNYRMKLMAMSSWDDEYNGCKTWWVVGHLPGFIKYETKLKSWEDVKADHKPNCWIRKYASCSDLLGMDREEEQSMKILKELGWKNDSMLGVRNYCDCKWTERNE